MNKCEICGKEVDFAAGGCALMMAVCRKHTVNLINHSYCSECYEQKPFPVSPVRWRNNGAEG